MVRIVGVVLLGLVLQACAMAATIDRDEAFFAALFGGPRLDGPGGGSCRQLRNELKAELEGIRTAQKKADDDFIAEQSAPAEEAQPKRFARKAYPRNQEMAPLKDVARRTKQAEAMNAQLKARGCRTMDVEEALKTPAQGPTPPPSQ